MENTCFSQQHQKKNQNFPWFEKNRVETEDTVFFFLFLHCSTPHGLPKSRLARCVVDSCDHDHGLQPLALPGDVVRGGRRRRGALREMVSHRFP